MAKITAVEPQKRSGRYNIYVDGDFVFGISEEVVLAYNLERGKDISLDELEALVCEDSVEKLVEKALHFLSYRPRSEQEIRNNLWKNIKKSNTDFKADPKWLVNKVIKKLEGLDLIDDEEFCDWWVNQRVRFKPRGKLLLRKELFEKGIKPEVMDKVLANYSCQDEVAWAQKLYEKKEARYRDLDPNERKEKIAALLSRRGFSWDVISQVLDSNI
ncbi:MAG: RecX family transcriptional regulator [Patescibacteria group bacterium]|nr:RecX family transcriptional regulator [Patescibacteria group bacterium]